ncbi:histone deacetylase family protein [Mesorhizobium xinjiangense]|uniref:histone deacetylase family protein n=1 Tax=Mesorhizobium xinjiangense TaxID=2678685 RepID=UPI0012EEBB48|nr:histone deacetylase [Mesorhizobium xinjiangense]
MALPIVHHPDYDAKFPAHHRFPMGKYSLLMEALRQRGLVEEAALHVPQPLAPKLLALAHDTTYVDQVLSRSVPAQIEREIGFPVDDRVARRAHLASSGTLLAARLALHHGIACNTAGGSHHAKRAHGAGFCTFNDVGVAASILIAEGVVRRVLVVDLDVHQGDGTADIFAREPRVFTFSMHAATNYPVRKIPSDLDIALPDGTGDAHYLAKVAEILPLLLDYARPDIVFYNAGVDPHADDRLGKLALSDDGLMARDSAVIGFFNERGVPVCGVIGGGYAKDVPALAERHATLFATAAEFAGRPAVSADS